MTVWFDFTTTRRNRGRNGIANVEWNLGMAILEADSGVRCFSLDERSGLIELDPQVDLRDVVYAESPNGTVGLGDLDRPGLRESVRTGLAIALGDHALGIDRALSNAYGSSKRLRGVATRNLRRRLPPARSLSRLVNLVSADDVVISVGADWSGELARRLGELKRSTGCRVVTMVYDLIPLTHTHLAFHQDRELFTSYYRSLLTTSDAIMCISSQTQHDLADFIEHHDVAAPPTSVLRLGDGSLATPPGMARRGDFFLVAGTIERRKNVELLYDALRILDSEGAALPSIVVAGAIGWGVGDFVYEIGLQSTPASRSMVLLGPVGDRALHVLYQRAQALLFPSHYEGWGLPLREAAVRGCPIAAGDSPAAREAIGSYTAAVMLPTDDPAAWADFMRRPPARAIPAEFYPWSSTVRQLRSILESQLGVGSFPRAGR